MRIFITGATGFIGSVVAAELLQAGHQLLGLARSSDAALRLEGAGIAPHRGDLEDLASLEAGARRCEAVVHLGFIHEFQRYAEVCEIDRRAVQALGEALPLGAPILAASGIAVVDNPSGARETDPPNPARGLRIATEQALQSMAGRAALPLRLPPTVHGAGDHGFVPMIADLAKKHGRSVFVEGTDTSWSAVHRVDVARLVRRVLEAPPEPGTRLHAVAERGVPFRAIAAAIAEGLGLPLVGVPAAAAAAHFGPLAHFVQMDMRAESEQTRRRWDWQPRESRLLEDMAKNYF